MSIAPLNAACNFGDVTYLINHWRRHGNEELNRVWPEIADDLKRISVKAWSDFLGPAAANATLSATDLLHETFPKLVGYPVARDFESRTQFYALCKSLMLYILMNYRRKKQRADRYHCPAETAECEAATDTPLDFTDIAALEQGLQRLKEVAPRQARIVEMRFYQDQSFQAIQDTLSLARTTVYTDLKAALLFLRHHLSQ